MISDWIYDWITGFSLQRTIEIKLKELSKFVLSFILGLIKQFFFSFSDVGNVV